MKVARLQPSGESVLSVFGLRGRSWTVRGTPSMIYTNTFFFHCNSVTVMIVIPTLYASSYWSWVIVGVDFFCSILRFPTVASWVVIWVGAGCDLDHMWLWGWCSCYASLECCFGSIHQRHGVAFTRFWQLIGSSYWGSANSSLGFTIVENSEPSRTQEGAEDGWSSRGHAYWRSLVWGYRFLIKSLVSHTPKFNLASRIITLIVDIGS